MHGITDKATLGALPGAVTPPRKSLSTRDFRPFLIAGAVLCLCFIKPLFDLLRVSLNEGFHSHIVLIPLISAYLIWIRRTELPVPTRGPAPVAVVGAILGSLILAVPLITVVGRPELLALRILAFWVFLATVVVTFLGWNFFRAVSFPTGFLLFMVPLPGLIVHPLEVASKYASAEAYAWMMDLSQSTYFRNGLVFHLPGISLEVADECSGIRSSLVLFIVGLLAGNLFLTNRWSRLALALFVFPLGIARNAFRIFTLSILSVHWDPKAIDGPIHHKGGPIFFALSLIPFCIVLMLLFKLERRKLRTASATGSTK